MFPPRLRLTPGERQFYLAVAFVALMGAVLACVITGRLASQGGGLVMSDPYTMWTLFAGAAGALAGFFSAYANWFGCPGPAGWIRAIIGGVVLSAVGSVVSGTLILPYYGTMFAPFQLIIAMIAYPALALAWIATLATAHRLLCTWRAERDSIFFTEEPVV